MQHPSGSDVMLRACICEQTNRPIQTFPLFPCLDERKLGGGNVQGIDVRRQAGVGLLGAVGAKYILLVNPLHV